jgi:DNA-binding response OmpR family regulator
VQPILVVEDDKEMRGLLAEVLRVAGYPVITANNGAQALVEMYRTRPSLILLDLMMPGMSGQQFRAAQLHDPAVSGIPVVCVSAAFDAAAAAAAMGAVGCVIKPIHFDELIGKIEAHLGPGHQAE